MATAARSPSATVTDLSFPKIPPSAASTVVLVGKKAALIDAISGEFFGDFSLDPAVATAALGSIDGPSGTTSFYVSGGESPRRLSLCVLPEKTTRNNHPLSIHAITAMVSKVCPGKGDVSVIVAGSSKETPAGPLACAVARAFPIYSSKTRDGKKDQEKREVSVSILDEGGVPVADADSLKAAEAASRAVRMAARLVDTPPAELTTEAFSRECKILADDLGDTVTFTEICGEELDRLGYGGLYGVGKGARIPPRLVVMTYNPPGDATPPETIALVGKGIVYDTGGLSLKGKEGMPGMKRDMGGAAGTLGGFVAAVQLGAKQRLHLVLCLAENAIGPDAVRNDDILTMYSGKTVEINNSDAEGRLVLGDGVAHATRNLGSVDLVLDMATLTGAQLVATGKKHAGILANAANLESRTVTAGLRSGDMCFPLLYAPELLMSEFKSEVADMKNSVKDRGNAQASCAGLFIESHLDGDYEGGWLHVDMAGPADKDERGTGYGVALILSLLGVPGF